MPQDLNPLNMLKNSALGDHIKKRRLDRGLTQKKVAEELGVATMTVLNWESNATTPQIHNGPMIILFLGYNPFPIAGPIGESLVSTRKTL